MLLAVIAVFAVILVILSALAFYAYVYHEDFEDVLHTRYTRYATFYNAFLPTWEKAVTTSLGESTPPTRSQLNAQVATLPNGPFPSLTDPLPPTLDLQTFQPVSQVALLNALQWMNQHMEEAHAALQNALKGGGTEGFEGATSSLCQQLTQCAQQQQQDKIAELLRYFDSFEANGPLQEAWARNQALVAESKKIQDQAQSGELARQFQAPESTLSFEKPAGARKGAEWALYKKTHPKEAGETEKTLGPWAAVADWAHGINTTLDF